MTLDTLFALALYALVTSITPGPNNTMLFISGVNNGFVRTIPHIAGISMGFFLMLMTIGAGLGRVFETFPIIHTVLKWVGIIYFLWLAWKITLSGSTNSDVEKAKPISFFHAAAFQWVNPKCWLMATGALAAFLPTGGGFTDILIITLIYVLINAPSVGVWAAFGMSLRHWLANPRINRIFNYLMAILLVGSLYPLVIEMMS